MNWVGNYFRFTQEQKKTIFSGVRVGTPEQRAAFIRFTEGAITLRLNCDDGQSPDVLKRRSMAFRDAAEQMLIVLNDGTEAGFTPEQTDMARQLMEQAQTHANDTTERLERGGRPDADGKALAAWIRDGYLHAFGKPPSLASGSAFEKLLGNIAELSPVTVMADPRLLKQAKTGTK